MSFFGEGTDADLATVHSLQFLGEAGDGFGEACIRHDRKHLDVAFECLYGQHAHLPGKDLLGDRLEQGGPDAKYMFDGFPRTLEQARLMDAEFARRGAKLSHVFLLDVSREVSLERLGGRRICRRCGANFHVRNIPPKTAGVCDNCGGELSQRSDDSRETILKRLEVFQQQAAGLIAYYAKRGVLQLVDSSGPRAETVADIMKRLQ